MSDPTTDRAARVGEYLSRGVLIDDPKKVLPRLWDEVREWEAYWLEQERALLARGGAEEPAVQEIHQIRRMLRFFVVPRLEEVAALPAVEQVRLLNLMTPFDTSGGLRDFLLHFFQLAENGEGKLEFQERDPYERELFVLHDLYRVKKTQEVIKVIREQTGRFPSAFPPDDQERVLEQLDTVLGLMFSQTLPPEHREAIRRDISPRYLSAEDLLKRREGRIMYLYPHVREKYDYRRFFFLIFFKDGLKAKLGEEERDYHYDFLRFQDLKREFLLHWLESNLKGNDRKLELYGHYRVHGRSMRSWVEEHPDEEAELLSQMPAPFFNQMVEEINDRLPTAEKVGFDTESEHFGFFHELKKQLAEAVALAKVPLQALREVVRKKAAPSPPASPAPRPAPPAAPSPPPPPPAAPASPAQIWWEAALLKKGQVGQTFLAGSTAGYAPYLAAIKSQMGADYKGFAEFTGRLLESTPEDVTIRRRTPKHEWTMPYHLTRIVPGEEREYLLILGAEVKAKPRGMGYTAKESYQFTPYFVLAAAQPEPRLGDSIGERKARGKTFLEYDPRSRAVNLLALELLEVVKEKIKRK